MPELETIVWNESISPYLGISQVGSPITSKILAQTTNNRTADIQSAEYQSKFQFVTWYSHQSHGVYRSHGVFSDMVLINVRKFVMNPRQFMQFSTIYVERDMRNCDFIDPIKEQS